ncbi:hypothetical protein [Paenibacillus polymyxa]|nr:hypothetical protein [Paenibacillus polymyxa]
MGRTSRREDPEDYWIFPRWSMIRDAANSNKEEAPASAGAIL